MNNNIKPGDLVDIVRINNGELELYATAIYLGEQFGTVHCITKTNGKPDVFSVRITSNAFAVKKRLDNVVDILTALDEHC